MPAKPKAGTKQINVELAEELLDEVKAFVEERGLTLRNFTERAFRRHLDNPPPVLPDPRLPDCGPEEPPSAAKPKRSRKKT